MKTAVGGDSPAERNALSSYMGNPSQQNYANLTAALSNATAGHSVGAAQAYSQAGITASLNSQFAQSQASYTAAPNTLSAQDASALNCGTSYTYVPYPYQQGWTYVPPLPGNYRLALEVIRTKNVPVALKRKAEAIILKALGA